MKLQYIILVCPVFAPQDCLSGDGKALMLVSVSPTVASAQETLQSLRFADQVRRRTHDFFVPDILNTI